MFSIVHGTAFLQLRITVTANQFAQAITSWTGLGPTDYYLTQNGLPVSSSISDLLTDVPVRVNERLPGGKGGFGSMLRAIGAQIEKTTNREACRDLSGRRLRDINEEKRLKAYLEKQQDASENERVKMQKKIDKLLSKPKHEFEDKEYEHQRSELIVETDEALLEGLQKVAHSEQPAPTEPLLAGKRKRTELASVNTKKKKNTLWLGNDDLSSSTETDSDSESDNASGPASNVHVIQKIEETVVSNADDKDPPIPHQTEIASTSNRIV